MERKSSDRSKLLIDLLMTVVLFLLMGMHLTGQMWHEISGTVCFGLFVVHHILNRRWLKGLLKGKYPALRVMQTQSSSLMLAG